MPKLKRCRDGLSCGFGCISPKKKCSDKCSQRAKAVLDSAVQIIVDPAETAKQAFDFLHGKDLAKGRKAGSTAEISGRELLNSYTSVDGPYREINGALRRGDPDPGWAKVASTLNIGLDSLSSDYHNEHKQLFRYGNLTPEQAGIYREAYARAYFDNKEFTEPGFVSTSHTRPNSNFSGNAMFEIEPKIGPKSAFKDLDTDEREVLSKSNTRFMLTDYKEEFNQNGIPLYRIKMKEVY